ncbi:unnamed protein product [Cyprideis torosa]|uniref:Phospholipid-transporting ATPase n=1 Tax=Cyprideis torosa TaxID=163714 RepID=A0A7R8ZM84_9CRUS|nr:unnamed protein product [Cyprideis torosa]CAG0885267.1 unnamed protein product [Cyprideis torosa]
MDDELEDTIQMDTQEDDALTVAFTCILACFVTLPLLMLVIGVQYMRECPLEPQIPVYLLVGGIVGMLVMFYLLWKQIRSRRYDRMDAGVISWDTFDDGILMAESTARCTHICVAIFLITWFAMGNYWILRIYKPKYSVFKSVSELEDEDQRLLDVLDSNKSPELLYQALLAEEGLSTSTYFPTESDVAPLKVVFRRDTGPVGPRVRTSQTRSCYFQLQSFISGCFGMCGIKDPFSGHDNVRIVVPNVPGFYWEPNGYYPNNEIRTQKYSWYSFLFINMWEQLSTLPTLYFLVLAFLNCLPQFRSFGSEVTVFPICVLLLFTAVKDWVEDRRKVNSDAEINGSDCVVYRAGEFKKAKWRDVLVGDVIRVTCDEKIPADLLLIYSSDSFNVAYIETSNLDGESSLKQRNTVPLHQQSSVSLGAQKHFDPSILVDHTIECSPPVPRITRFYGNLFAPDGSPITLGAVNLLPRDCVLRNTNYVIGIAIYTGGHTKSMLNTGPQQYKRSFAEKRLDGDILLMLLILCILCVVSTVGNLAWEWRAGKFLEMYLYPEEGNLATLIIISFIRNAIIFQNVLPISLFIMMEFCRLWYGYDLMSDQDLRVGNRQLQCRTFKLLEDLGMVQHIFSDKTGTLTQNAMVFRRCHVTGQSFDHQVVDIAPESFKEEGSNPSLTRRRRRKMAVETNQSLFKEMEALSKISDPRTLKGKEADLWEFFLLLVTCHTVMVSRTMRDRTGRPRIFRRSLGRKELTAEVRRSIREILSTDTVSSQVSFPLPQLVEEDDEFLEIPRKSATKEKQRSSVAPPPPERIEAPIRTCIGHKLPQYEGESPDEIALVEFAFHYGFRLLGRQSLELRICPPGIDKPLSIRIIQVLYFDPQRKSMSVVIRSPLRPSHLLLLCKGAESSMIPRLEASPADRQAIQKIVDDYAADGLRTLVLAKREIRVRDYVEWVKRYRTADLKDWKAQRENNLRMLYLELERDMAFLGVTGVEDRLQDGTAETIEALTEAGITFWILTGDKTGTAINVAKSCHALKQDAVVLNISGTTAKALIASLNKAFYEIQTGPRTKQYGVSIEGRTLALLKEMDKDIQKSFCTLTSFCDTVVCSRATPIQKEDAVLLVQEHEHCLTMAIGDGANDVAMLQRAHLGIAVEGVEGAQAILASDVSIPMFRHLKKLLLVHGHNFVERIQKVPLYIIYKQMFLTLVMFWMQLYNGLSGYNMVPDICIFMFGLIWTAGPILLLGLVDRVLPDHDLLRYPPLYAQGSSQLTYNTETFWGWLGWAYYQSLIAFFMARLTFPDAEALEFGVVITTSIVWIANFTLFFVANTVTYMLIWSVACSILVFYGVMIAASCIDYGSLEWFQVHLLHGVIADLFLDSRFYLVTVISVVASILPLCVYRALVQTLRPNLSTIIARENQGKYWLIQRLRAAEEYLMKRLNQRGEQGTSTSTTKAAVSKKHK